MRPSVRKSLSSRFSVFSLFFIILTIILSSVFVVFAQLGELAATLEVLDEGVEVRRVNTTQWLPVKVEAIVGVGDDIRTNETGRARITFFADGVDTELLPSTEYRIVEFMGDDQSFTLSVEVLIGETVQRIGRALDTSSSYDVKTPAMTLTARGTAFVIRVEDTGRAAMLVTEGIAEAAAEDATASVPPEFGVRTNVGETPSDVVRAKTFAELDSALDGCTATLETPDDVSINVRISPTRDALRVGTIASTEVTLLIGKTENDNWYRIPFRGGFGWILSSTAVIATDCVGLRLFPNDHPAEDIDLYSVVGDPVETPTDAPETTPTESPTAATAP